MLKQEELIQELKDNRSHVLVTLLDFADQMKNQVKDQYYRNEIEMLLSDTDALRKKYGAQNTDLARELDILIAGLSKLKQTTQIQMEKPNGEKYYIDYHKGCFEYLKKRIHCEINNSDRRIRLALGVPLEKQRIQPFGANADKD